jgi:hypothetical protein
VKYKDGWLLFMIEFVQKIQHGSWVASLWMILDPCDHYKVRYLSISALFSGQGCLSMYYVELGNISFPVFDSCMSFWHSWHKNLVNTFLDFDGNQLLNDEDSDLDACNKKSLEEHLNKPKLL